MLLNIAEQELFHYLRRNSRRKSSKRAIQRETTEKFLLDTLDELVDLKIAKDEILY